jgi:hypothetical protein
MRPALVQAALGAPGDLQHSRVLAGLAFLKPFADCGAAAVVLGGLDQEPARVGRAGLGDLALEAFAVRGVLRRNDTEEPRQQRGLLEAIEASDFRAQPGGGERVDAAEATQPCHRLGVAALWHCAFEHFDQGSAALHKRALRAQVVKNTARESSSSKLTLASHCSCA